MWVQKFKDRFLAYQSQSCRNRCFELIWIGSFNHVLDLIEWLAIRLRDDQPHSKDLLMVFLFVIELRIYSKKAMREIGLLSKPVRIRRKWLYCLLFQIYKIHASRQLE